MLFARKTHDYTVMYKKREAVKMLLADERVKSVNSFPSKMIVITNPIFLKSERFNKWILGPIGTYTITIKCNVKHNNLKINIKRNEGTLIFKNNIVEMLVEKFLHFHVRTNWTDNNICWGTANEEVNIIRKNKDWFWFVKRVLDLLQDGDPEYDNGYEREFDNFFICLIGLQASYAKKHNLYNTKLKKELIKFWKRKIVCDVVSESTWLEVREWLLE